jgi:hypothetical protein
MQCSLKYSAREPLSVWRTGVGRGSRYPEASWDRCHVSTINKRKHVARFESSFASNTDKTFLIISAFRHQRRVLVLHKHQQVYLRDLLQSSQREILARMGIYAPVLSSLYFHVRRFLFSVRPFTPSLRRIERQARWNGRRVGGKGKLREKWDMLYLEGGSLVGRRGNHYVGRFADLANSSFC